MSDDDLPPEAAVDQPAQDNAGERTVVASADVLAAALAQAEAQAEARAAATAFVPTVPPVHTIPPPATAGDWAVEAAIEALPPAHAAVPAVPSFGNGPPGGLIGYQLNDLFEIVRFIARGGMGEVYEGRNIASGERVAIKVILPQFAVDEQFMALFRREASALERLGHDALVKYRTLAFDRTSQLNYLAIEFVDGVPMSDSLDGVPAEAATVRVVLRRLAAGLGAAHIAGVIHRDLSPDNILLPNGDVARAKIIDFGIAKDTNPGEKSVVGDAFAGKFGYAAPEIFGKYKRSVGPWTDVYSLALTVLALAKGRPLDMGITIVDALEARDTVPDLSFLEPDLVRVFTGMLQPDPEVRFRSMEAVIEALDAPAAGGAGDQFGMTAGAPTMPPPASPAFVRADAPSIAPPARPKSKAPLFGGIAAAVLLLGGAGGYLALSGGPKSPADLDATAAPPQTASARCRIESADPSGQGRLVERPAAIAGGSRDRAVQRPPRCRNARRRRRHSGHGLARRRHGAADCAQRLHARRQRSRGSGDAERADLHRAAPVAYRHSRWKRAGLQPRGRAGDRL